ncbi:hypothetical protein O9H85_22885 [Paenibacillus filicis]|uniref:DUF3813 domain-containing protein n=1 Tax=Paenibacillus gyeongsangnamensis TaxID=3388067 RepID=A0ABT4QEM4_9BACL|nr:hypothetical protein [Paenibacillus filicis]MCZ8515211.1 hypothetical protein [Paenibacillus filicis]
MPNQPSDNQEQNSATEAQNAVNHALSELNEATHLNDRGATQSAHEQLSRARQLQNEANNQDTFS